MKYIITILIAFFSFSALAQLTDKQLPAYPQINNTSYSAGTPGSLVNCSGVTINSSTVISVGDYYFCQVNFSCTGTASTSTHSFIINLPTTCSMTVGTMIGSAFGFSTINGYATLTSQGSGVTPATMTCNLTSTSGFTASNLTMSIAYKK